MVGPLKGRDTIGYKRLLCGTYRCPRCRPKKLRHVRSCIAKAAGELRLTRLATLTLDKKRIRAAVPSDRHIRECWRKMRVVLARRYGNSVPFIAILEFQKSGKAHLHVLVGIYIPQRWLSKAWQGIGGGRIVDIRYVDVHRVAGYVASYLTNDKVKHTLTLLPPRARIFSCSRGIGFSPKKENSGWWVCPCSIDELRDYVKEAEGERWEDVEGVGIPVLIWFEGPLIPAALVSFPSRLRVSRDS